MIKKKDEITAPTALIAANRNIFLHLANSIESPLKRSKVRICLVVMHHPIAANRRMKIGKKKKGKKKIPSCKPLTISTR